MDSELRTFMNFVMGKLIPSCSFATTKVNHLEEERKLLGPLPVSMELLTKERTSMTLLLSSFLLLTGRNT